MRARASRIVLTWGLALISSSVALAAPSCTVVAPSDAPPLVRQAATELSAYLARWGEGTVPVAVAPTARGASIVLRLVPQEPLGDEEYFITSPPGGRVVVEIRARTPQGILQGAYRLLREYGFGFYFDGDAIPARPPGQWRIPDIHGQPVFAIRGSLPWYNFLDSPTTWDDQDFRFLADQLIRSGQNFLGFHSYDMEPFTAYDYAGQLLNGQPLQTTAQSVWGTAPLPVRQFGFGTSCLFPGEFWGSDVARHAGAYDDRIREQKALLARGLAYASARGVKTCLGWEVAGDPTDPAEQRRFQMRLMQIVRDYPMLDYVWLWQSEGRAMDGTAPPALRSQAGRIYRDWQDAFAYLGAPRKRWEGMRMAAYGRLAQQLMDNQAPGVKIVLSGWGGDHWLHVSDYFPAWDKVLDKRLIFAALDDIRVSPQVSANYKLSPARERWAIPWYEYDGDQWFPQANAAIFAQTVRDARAKGCQGLLAIHWRTKEVGESQALVADYAWHPDRTLEAFYRDYGTRRAGPVLGPQFGAILQQLDALGYRWLGGAGQSECGPFAWCAVDNPERVGQLRKLREQLSALRQALPTQPAPSGALGCVDDIIATVDRCLIFNEISRVMTAGGPVDKALALSADDPQRKAECARVLATLPHLQFARMLAYYAQTITSRGELGVLATINGKAFVDYRDKLQRLQEGAGVAADASPLAVADPSLRGVVSDYQLTSVSSGAALPVRCMATDRGRSPLRVRLQYCSSANPRWVEVRMPRLERDVFEAAIPAAAVRPGWLRYRIVADFYGAKLAWPEVRGEPYRQVTVLPADALRPRQNAVTMEPPPLPPNPQFTIQATPSGGLQLSWPGAAAGHELAVERRQPGGDWQRLGTALDWQFEDAATPPDMALDYRLMQATGGAVASASLKTPPAPPVTAPAQLTARPHGIAVRLDWSPGDLTVSHYVVERAASRDGPFAAVAPDQRLVPTAPDDNVFVDRPRQTGTVYYRVAAHGLGMAPPVYSPVAAAEAIAEVPPPLVDINFAPGAPAGTIAGLEFTGPHSFIPVDGRSVLRTDGGFTLPYSESLAVKGPFTVAIRFRWNEPTQMPVLVSQGAWLGPGYFVQLYAGRVRFYVGGAGYLDSPADVRPGAWHILVCVHDGATLANYLDGVLLGEIPVTGAFTPATAHFTVARYTDVGTDWTLRGDVDFVRLYAAALEPWMVVRRRPAKPGVMELDWRTPAVSFGGHAGVWRQDAPRTVDSAQGRAAELNGGLVVPFSDDLPVGDRLTIETSFLLRDAEGMPVLINQGMWPSEGYMVQILGRHLRFHVGGVGSLDGGPEFQPGRWYALKCTYDGWTLRAWVDGQPVGELARSNIMIPSTRPLRIGNYEIDQEQYVFRGLIGRTVIRGTVE